MIAEEVSALPFDLPSDWTQTTVDTEFHLILGKMLDAEKNTGVSRNYLGNKAVQWGDIDVEDLAEIKLTKSDLRRYRLVAGDLLVCEGGDIGRCAIWHSQLEECYFQKALHRVRTRGNFSIILLRYLLEYYSKTGFLLNFATQTSIAHLPKDKFQQVPLPFPPPLEQQTIAEALSDADGVVEGLERLIEKKRRIKQGAMQDLLTAKRRLPGFSGEWRKSSVSESSHLPKLGCIPSSIPERVFEHYSLPAFDNGKKPVFEKGIKIQSNKLMVPKDALLVSKLNPRISRVWLPEIKSEFPVCSTEFIILVPYDGINRRFLNQFFQSPRIMERMKLRATGTTGSHQRISPQVFAALEIDVPTPSEQDVIAEILDHMDAEITALETRLQKARAIKEGMMQNLLTGRIRLV